MSNEVKVENLIIALNNISSWCGIVAKALASLDPNTVVELTPEDHKEIADGPRQSISGC